MLRNRSRAVSTKQALMADQTPNPMILSPPTKPSSPISSFLNSPRFFNGFWKKNQFFSDPLETNNNNNNNNNINNNNNPMMIMSPTSILDTKNNNSNTTSNNSFVNPFGYDNYILSPTAKQDTNKGIGLALIDSIVDDESENLGKFSKAINRTALFGSKLKVQIPVAVVSSISPTEESPKSPADFGIKTKSSQISSPPSKDCYFTRQLSLKEMELSEDYTRVITHGPNPKTTHIFDDCIVESCLGDANEPKDCDEEEEDKEMDCGFGANVSTSNFMSFCHTCKDILGQGKDIYIYRGEKAFCSHECRSEEIYYDGMKNSGSDE